MRKKRLIAVFTVLAVVLALLFSVCFVIAEADHDCCGEDCRICWQIAACENTLRVFGAAALSAVIVRTACLFVTGDFVPDDNPQFSPSLVSLKVKLSD